jgi:hypothetical protein
MRIQKRTPARAASPGPPPLPPPPLPLQRPMVRCRSLLLIYLCGLPGSLIVGVGVAAAPVPTFLLTACPPFLVQEKPRDEATVGEAGATSRGIYGPLSTHCGVCGERGADVRHEIQGTAQRRLERLGRGSRGRRSAGERRRRRWRRSEGRGGGGGVGARTRGARFWDAGAWTRGTKAEPCTTRICGRLHSPLKE